MPRPTDDQLVGLLRRMGDTRLAVLAGICRRESPEETARRLGVSLNRVYQQQTGILVALGFEPDARRTGRRGTASASFSKRQRDAALAWIHERVTPLLGAADPSSAGGAPGPTRAPPEGRAPAPRAESAPSTAVAPARLAAGARHNLPTEATSFVGREDELAEVKRLLRSARLVTLTGPGGAGKTRLAVRAAADLLDAFPDGVWFLDMAPVGVAGDSARGNLDPVLAARVGLAAVGAPEQSGQPPLAALVEHLRDRTALLVVDNCEHMVEACAQLADAIVRGCPGTRLLATSREALDVPGEVRWPVPPLGVPEPRPRQTAELVLGSVAVRLFVDRARAVQPHFRVTDGNSAAVARICQRLDGIPLALELAAARVRVLSPEQIADRLDDAFDLLAGGRARPPRQQALRASVDWSHDLLAEPERVLLRRLSVFAGGFTLESAEGVCADAVGRSDVLELLTRLLDKSLIVIDADGPEPRYRLHETIRQYATEKLVAAGEVASLRERHARWFVAVLDRAAPDLAGPTALAWLDRFEGEHDNLRAALSWWCQTGGTAAEAGLRMAANLSEWFWSYPWYMAEGVAWLERLLALVPARTRTRALALRGTAFLLRRRGQLERARALGQEAIELFAERGDRRDEAVALAHLAMVEANLRDYAAAAAHAEASVALLRQDGDRFNLTHRLREAALVAVLRGDRVCARAYLEESLTLARALGDTSSAGMALLRLGIVDRLEGAPAAARARVDESLPLLRQSRHQAGVWMARGALASLAADEGDSAAARRELDDVLREVSERGLLDQVPDQLCRVGILAERAGDPARAVRLIAAGARDGVVGTADSPDVRLEAEAALSRARADLGDAAYDAAWRAGAALGLRAAVREAIEL